MGITLTKFDDERQSQFFELLLLKDKLYLLLSSLNNSHQKQVYQLLNIIKKQNMGCTQVQAVRIRKDPDSQNQIGSNKITSSYSSSLNRQTHSNHSNHSKKFFLVTCTCMEMELINRIPSFLEEQNYAQEHDHLAIAGGSLGFTEDKQGKFLQHFAIEKSPNFVFIDHKDCKIYNNFYKVNPLNEKSIHQKHLFLAREKLQKVFPFAQAELFLMEADGTAITIKADQEYLDKVFEELRVTKKIQKYQKPVENILNGFKTIPIQKLQPKNIKQKQKIDGFRLWHRQFVKDVSCYQQSCSLNMKYHNGFFGAFYEAYINHGDVKITPDDVWSAIMLYFSKYADSNAEKLRNAFVTHEGRKQLVVQTNINQPNHWSSFFKKMIIQIKKNTVKGVTQKLQCCFSTTDTFFSFFSTAIIMNSYKKYFDFRHDICACGIQNIHMGGTLEDWEKVLSKLLDLKQFDVDGRLKEYVTRLEPVIEQFIETYKGAPHLQFWNNLYHERENPKTGVYQPKTYINGWILRFFTTYDSISQPTELQVEQFDIPVKVIDQSTNKAKDMNLVGGCVGVSVTSNIYRPHFSFSVVEKWKKSQNQRQDRYY